MNEILAVFSEQGLDPGTIELDGKIHRFAVDQSDSKNSGWYIGYQNFTRGGEDFQVVIYGNYRLGETYTYKTDRKYSADDRKFIKEKLVSAQKATEAVRKKLHEDTANEVAAKFEKLSLTGESSYLNKKQISDCKNLGIKFDLNGDFYVPMRDTESRLWSLQKIQWDGSKFFYPGGRVTECFHVLGEIESVDTILICEGFATGASIRLATASPVVIAFNSVNLPVVASALKTKYQNKKFIICGDNDLWTKRPDGSPWNPGREKAEDAAKRCFGVAAFPKFKELIEKKTTDFNDLYIAEGLDAVRSQIIAVKSECNESFVFALGFSENNYFFTSSQNKQIVPISRFTETDFLGLMPIGYWEAIYPGAGVCRVDWTEARSHLMAECRRQGIFHSLNVRGSGVWRDNGRTVVNMGDHLVVDGERFELGKIKSRYFYTLGANFSSLRSDPLCVRDCQALVEACETFKWLKPEFGILLAGALVVSRVCGALPVRPHVWITGGAGEGKSTLLEKLIRPVLGSSMLYVQGSTTEAGIRQSLKANAVPLLFDEFESQGQKSIEIVQAVLDLLRASWGDSDAQVVKGSAGGTAIAFRLCCSAIVSSIRTKLMNDADVSRFARIELMPHGSDTEHWSRLSSLLDQLNPDYCERLFSRTVKMMPTLLANFKIIKSALAKKVSSRFGDQYGMLLAGYSVLLQDEIVNDAQVKVIIDRIGLTDEKDEAKIADHDDCMTQTQTKKIRFEKNGSSYERTVAELILDARFDIVVNEALQRLGIKVTSEAVAIASKHTELESQIYRGTRWSQTWSNSLSRLPNAKKNVPVWIAGKTQKCVTIPMAYFSG